MLERAAQPLWIVTGATGFLGNNLVRTLIAEGQRVRACDLDPSGAESLAGLDCDRVPLDVTDAESVVAAFTAPPGTRTWVVHCAGIVSIAGKVSPKVRQVNVGGTANVLDACRATGVERLVHVSSVHAIPEPEPPQLITELDAPTDFDPTLVVGGYAKTKAEATALVLTADDVWRVVVHPSGMIGPYDFADTHLTRMVRDALGGGLTAVVEGRYDFVDVRDVCAGIIAAANRGESGRPYLLTGHKVSVADLTGGVLEIAGRKRRLTALPIWFAKLTAPLAELYYKIRRTAPLYTSYSLHTLQSPCDFSHERATRELGYMPRPFTDTLRDTVTWTQRHPPPAGAASRR